MIVCCVGFGASVLIWCVMRCWPGGCYLEGLGFCGFCVVARLFLGRIRCGGLLVCGFVSDTCVFGVWGGIYTPFRCGE